MILINPVLLVLCFKLLLCFTCFMLNVWKAYFLKYYTYLMVGVKGYGFPGGQAKGQPGGGPLGPQGGTASDPKVMYLFK